MKDKRRIMRRFFIVCGDVKGRGVAAPRPYLRFRHAQ